MASAWQGTIAEGVETEEQAILLAQPWAVNRPSGLFGRRPLPASAFIKRGVVLPDHFAKARLLAIVNR